jgi:hypothetical protein
MLGKHIRNVLYKFGFDLVRYGHISHPVARRLKLLSHYGIDLIFDIGAKPGQYAQEIRKRGYTGRIVSLEKSPGLMGFGNSFFTTGSRVAGI